MSNVLLTYGWVRSSYAALRNLSKHGISVVASDSTPVGMCQFSKLSVGFERYTSHYLDEDKFISDLISICSKKNVNLIFPSHNETEIIARHRDKFSPGLVALVPYAAHCEIFNNKSLSYDLAAELAIPVARRICYSDPKDLSHILSEAGLKKTVIKLLTGNSGKGVFYGESPEHSQSIVQKLIDEYSLDEKRFPQVEEYVNGEGYGCSVLYWNGRHIAGFTHRRLRDKISTGGTSTFREVSAHKGIETATRKIFETIGWHGLAMCEFKVCPKTGKFWFIEVNPRMWGSIPLAIEAGVEFPFLAWLCAAKGPKAALSYHAGCKLETKWTAKWLLGDIFLALSHLFRLRIKSAWRIVSAEQADSKDDFFTDDVFVFFGEVLAYLRATMLSRSTNPAEKGMLK